MDKGNKLGSSTRNGQLVERKSQYALFFTVSCSLLRPFLLLLLLMTVYEATSLPFILICSFFLAFGTDTNGRSLFRRPNSLARR